MQTLLWSLLNISAKHHQNRSTYMIYFRAIPFQSWVVFETQCISSLFSVISVTIRHTFTFWWIDLRQSNTKNSNSSHRQIHFTRRKRLFFDIFLFVGFCLYLKNLWPLFQPAWHTDSTPWILLHNCQHWDYVHIDTSTSSESGFRFCSYKLHPYEWAFMVICTRITQRVSTDNLQLNRIERMLCEKVTIFHYIVNNILLIAHPCQWTIHYDVIMWKEYRFCIVYIVRVG